MTVAVEKLKSATQRFQLVRMEARRHLSSTLVSLGSGQYQVDLGFVPILRSGAPIGRYSDTDLQANLALVSAFTGDDQYTISGSVITVKLASAPNATTNQILMSHLILLSTDPVDRTVVFPGVDNRSYRFKPILKGMCQVRQSVSNILQGVFTIEPTTFVINNEGSELDPILGDQDSVHNGSCQIWECFNSTANRQIIFDGRINAIQKQGDDISITAESIAYLLKQKAALTLGGPVGYAYYGPTSVGGVTQVYPADVGRPIPILFGERTPASTIDNATEATSIRRYDQSLGTKAVCITYDQNLSRTVNRVWSLGRIRGSLRMQSFGAIQATTKPSIHRYVRFASYSNLYVGDPIRWTESGTTYTGIIGYVGTFTYSAVTYNVLIYTEQAMSTSSTMTALQAMNIRIKGGTISAANGIAPSPTDHYSISQISVGTYTQIVITFVNNFESSFAFGTLDPNVHTVEYTISDDAACDHASVVDDLVRKSGLITLSFAAATAALTANTCFTIPFIDESDFSDFLTYLTAILQSTLGILTLEPYSGLMWVAYNLLATPSSTDERSDSHFSEAVETAIDYQDIVTAIVPVNPHLLGGSSTLPKIVSTASKLLNLHHVESDRYIEYRHVLASSNGDIDRSAAIIGVKSSPLRLYRYSVDTIDAETNIGTDLLLSSDQLPSQVQVKVLGITRTTQDIKIEASDLAGLT